MNWRYAMRAFAPHQIDDRQIDELLTATQGMRRLLFVLAACSFFVGLDSLITVPLLPAIVASSDLALESDVFLVTAYEKPGERSSSPAGRGTGRRAGLPPDAP